MIESKGQTVFSETSRGEFWHFTYPSILNRVKNELADSRPMKTIKKEKYRFYCFIGCSVEVFFIQTVTRLQNMVGNIKSAVFTYGGRGEGEFCC